MAASSVPILPAEILHVIFRLAFDLTRLDSTHYRPDERYKLETPGNTATEDRDKYTMQSLLLVSRTFYSVAREIAWSWVSVWSVEKLHRLDAIISSRSRRNPGDSSFDEQDEPTNYPACWIRRLDIQLKLNADAYNDNSPAARAVSCILRSCTNLEIFKSDIEIQSEDCARTPQPVLSALKSLRNLRRLDFAGHEGPSLGDYITLIPYLTKLEQLRTGRIAEPLLTEDQITEEIRKLGELSETSIMDVNTTTGPTPAMNINTTFTTTNARRTAHATQTPVLILPSLRALQIPRSPLTSCLRVFKFAQLPSLTYFAHHHIDFHLPRTVNFFAAIGPQLTHIYTSGVRTPDAPWGSARILFVCPNLIHLTYTPRLKDENYERSWQHKTLRSLGIRSILPNSMPPRQELAVNISRSITEFLQEISRAKASRSSACGKLPNLEVIRLEDGVGDIPMEYIRLFGKEWATVCQDSIVLEDGRGQRVGHSAAIHSPLTVPATGAINSYAREKEEDIGTVPNTNYGQSGSNMPRVGGNRNITRASMMRLVSPIFALLASRRRSQGNSNDV